MRVIEATVRHCAGNLARTAKILRINRSTLYLKIKLPKDQGVQTQTIATCGDMLLSGPY
jgi:DNA-binding NtrC family response regulator